MQVIEEVTFHGRELIVIQDGHNFMVDVRADAEDGPLVAGFTGFCTPEGALQAGKDYVTKAGA